VIENTIFTGFSPAGRAPHEPDNVGPCPLCGRDLTCEGKAYLVDDGWICQDCYFHKKEEDAE